MLGIDTFMITYKLNMSPSLKPMKQKRKKCAQERNQVINDDVYWLEANDSILIGSRMW